ncbi:MAG TPA: hypothetical protein VG963_05005, partial [Polyangiaceae bacterium]|nr:hypothetical protein [Polyangiaceae bacterium]
PHVVIVRVLSYLLSGHRSICPAQRLSSAKGGRRLARPTALREPSALPDGLAPAPEDGASRP